MKLRSALATLTTLGLLSACGEPEDTDVVPEEEDPQVEDEFSCQTTPDVTWCDGNEVVTCDKDAQEVRYVCPDSCGEVDTDFRWCEGEMPAFDLAGSYGSSSFNSLFTYHVREDLYLVDSTIKAGTRFVFYPNVDLEIEGDFTVEGTVDDPVVFTSSQRSPAPGDWGRLIVPDNQSADLRFTTIEYGSGLTANGNLTLQDSVLRHISPTEGQDAALYSEASTDHTLRIKRTTIEQVTAGSGLVAWAPYTLVMSDSTVQDVPDGLGVELHGGEITLKSNTISRVGKSGLFTVYGGGPTQGSIDGLVVSDAADIGLGLRDALVTISGVSVKNAPTCFFTGTFEWSLDLAYSNLSCTDTGTGVLINGGDFTFSGQDDSSFLFSKIDLRGVTHAFELMGDINATVQDSNVVATGDYFVEGSEDIGGMQFSTSGTWWNGMSEPELQAAWDVNLRGTNLTIHSVSSSEVTGAGAR